MSHAPIISTPAERIATVFAWILAGARRGLANNLAKLDGPVQMMLYRLVGEKITQTRDRLIRLAERVAAGWTYQPKPYAKRKSPTRPPRTPDPLTTGSLWLVRAAPGHDTTAAAAADLRRLLEEPEIAAVLAAAPVPAWRIVRSLCWALGVRKPAVLGPSKPPKPGKPLPMRPRPLPWEIVPETPELPTYHQKPSFFRPWIGPKPKTA